MGPPLPLRSTLPKTTMTLAEKKRGNELEHIMENITKVDRHHERTRIWKTYFISNPTD